MATFNKFNCFVEDLAEGAHDLDTHTLKVALSNTAPDAADTTWNTIDHPAPAADNGYTAGGNTLTVSSSSQTSGTYRLIIADSVFTASGGQLGPVRYAIVYNDTSGDKPIGWYDYGSSITLEDTETLTIDFDGTNGLFSLA